MPNSTKPTSQALLTKRSLALSLAPPRSHPFGTAHRALLTGGDFSVADLPWTRHGHHDFSRYPRKEDGANGNSSSSSKNEKNNQNDKDKNNYNNRHPNVTRNRRLLVEYLRQKKKQKRRQHQKPHPHLSMDPDLIESISRSVAEWLPLSWQNRFRDGGYFRWSADSLMRYFGPPMAMLKSPNAVVNFQRLTKKCITLRYGNHPMQIIDLFLPDEDDESATSTTKKRRPRGLVFFVHGGGWGCGSPWLYRLVACPFLDMGLAVAIVGYRTFPCGDVLTQVLDLELASAELAQQYPNICVEPTEFGVVVMGHSSGAHISFLMMAEWTKRKMENLEKIMSRKQADKNHQQKRQEGGDNITASSRPAATTISTRFDIFVGISGPYNISHHFDYEASRGLEEMSPLKAACGFSREEFLNRSPALKIVRTLSSKWSRECAARALDNVIPRMCLMHGVEDDIVPFTSSAEAASLLRSCGVTNLDEIYLAKTRHNQCAIELMVGGQVQDTLVDWLEKQSSDSQHSETNKKRMVLQSRL